MEVVIQCVSGKRLEIDCTGLLLWFVMSLDWELLFTINRSFIFLDTIPFMSARAQSKAMS